MSRVSRQTVSAESTADSPNGRSGCCLEETYPRMHAICPGEYQYRATSTASPEWRRCSCRCHEVGVDAMGMPSLRMLLYDLSRGVLARRGGLWLHGNWKGPKTARARNGSAWPLN